MRAALFRGSAILGTHLTGMLVNASRSGVSADQTEASWDGSG
jgi:hypothetical protein